MKKSKTKTRPSAPVTEVDYRHRVVSYSSPDVGIWANLMCTVSTRSACAESFELLGINLPTPLASAVRVLCAEGKQVTIGLFELRSFSKLILVDVELEPLVPKTFVFHRKDGSAEWTDMTDVAIVDVDGCDVDIEALSELPS